MTESLQLFLIEDDDDVALLMRNFLERAGHKVQRCRTAADALLVLSQTSFDLALLDQRLPDMSGLELLRTLAQENITVPILMVTGHGDEELASRVFMAGVLDYLVKDQSLAFLSDLPKRVVECVNRHRLQQFNRLLVSALESARDGIMITDLDGIILHVNQALVDMTGYDRQELLGKQPSILKSGIHSPDLYREMWRVILARGSWQGELTNRRKNGSLFEASLTVSPILDVHGRLTHFVGIQRDVTAHKQLERQLRQAQKMQSVGTLAGGVAHEFNNLLAGINGYAALGLREAEVSTTVREFLQNIVDLSERAAVLTRQLLAFARKPALTRRPTAMNELVRATADLISRTMQQEVLLDVADQTANGEPLIVEADANQLQQAIINLALNARDALHDRQQAAGTGSASAPLPPIRIRLRDATLDRDLPAFPQSIPAGKYVCLEVEDSGCGMPQEVMNQALDPFFTTKEVGQGTGLGLPVVFGIVQGHQGYLGIRSQLNVGTCMSVYLPRVAVTVLDETGKGYPEPSHLAEQAPATGASILVVDDEEAVLDVVRRFLQIAGHKVHCAGSGAAALEMLSGGLTVDLVILDLMMPRENSASTFQRLHDRWPSLPVLLCTGLVRDDAPVELLEAGAAGLIRKPFRMQDLWAAVKQALGQSQAGQR